MKNQIKTIKLNDGNRMPELGFGTWKLKGEKCRNAVKIALEVGYAHIDTAEVYGNEKEIGDAIGNFDRKKLFIVSKVWPGHYSHDNVLKACNNSLKRLKTDYLDLYLIHWPTRGMNLSEMFRAFKKLKDEGKVKSVGVSNFMVKHLERALPIAKSLGIKIAVNQIEFHPFLYQKKLLDFCKANNIAVTAYSPLARGRVFANETMKKIASKYNKNAGQIAIKWLLQKGMIVIPKASSREHIASNLEVFDFKLDDCDVEMIDRLGERDVEINGFIGYALRFVKKKILWLM